jgi:hypothetical protein
MRRVREAPSCGRRRSRLARAGRLDERRDQPRRRRRSRALSIDATRDVGRAGLRFCAALSAFAPCLISSISVPSRRPTAAAAALPASLTALPARLPARPAAAAGEAMLGERGERRRRRDRDQLGDQRALQQLDERLAALSDRPPPPRGAAALGHALDFGPRFAFAFRSPPPLLVAFFAISLSS